MINLVLKCKITSMLLLDASLQPLGCGYNRTSKFSQCFSSEKEQLCGLTGSHLWSAAVVTVEPVHIRIKKKNKPKKAVYHFFYDFVCLCNHECTAGIIPFPSLFLAS